ncbi:MAG: ribosome recycling factor [Patescibacteria group bacterium]
MAHQTVNLQKSIEETKKWFQDELGTLRTGRATPALLDSVQLEVYGSRMKLNQVASVMVSDARSLYVTPYDLTQVKAIEKAISVADLGVSVGSDEKGVRVSFPELTSERRQQLIKLMRGKLEEARIAIKKRRSEEMALIEKAQKDSEMGEDDARRAKDDVQKLIDAGNRVLEELADKKEAELSN